jgi:hypothetical protein
MEQAGKIGRAITQEEWGTTERDQYRKIHGMLAEGRALLAEIQRVVASELKRLAVQFNDQAESLIAIHERQAKLNCPQ